MVQLHLCSNINIHNEHISPAFSGDIRGVLPKVHIDIIRTQIACSAEGQRYAQDMMCTKSGRTSMCSSVVTHSHSYHDGKSYLDPTLWCYTHCIIAYDGASVLIQFMPYDLPYTHVTYVNCCFGQLCQIWRV